MNCGCCFGGCVRALCCCGSASCRDQDNMGIEFAMNYTGLSVCHAAILELNTPLDRSTMTGAWYKTLQTHPFLRAKWCSGFISTVKGNTEPTYLDITQSQEMVDQLIFHSNKDAKFAELTVCEQGLTIQILVTIPHSLADGTAMMIILNDLLKFYEKPHQSAILDEVYPVQAEKLKPELTKEAQNNYKEKVLAKQKEFKNIVPHHKNSRRQQKASSFLSKEWNHDWHFLMAAFNFVNSRVIQKLGNELKMDIDYNLRDRFPQKLGNTVVACYIGLGSINPKADFSETMVDVAKRIKKEINEQLENQEPFMVGAFMEAAQMKPENNHIDGSVNFSNVGKYKFDTEFSFGKIRELYCSGNKWINSYEYGLLFQTTDKLCVTITHPDMKEYNETAQIYLQGLIDVAEAPEVYGDMTLRHFANI
ncbi:Oidioi.mRNA.OKI2018_I69.PAR.g9288.t1.cds [Oikopleura dioica]|uniref:Oidioi.mRNA.OKI2018_I69.PAR.g9288.t1.cds n=1 Tax=Oikopleura dioica TaxID=34765 RepID=A0ABN7RNK1_OIKDI|nr:Oidioi.mRNA.OKI2018_I69.PAR.g9288.t1.cds [Oikopleura dioica]